VASTPARFIRADFLDFYAAPAAIWARSDEAMTNLIEERVALAREGRNPWLIARMASGWCVAGDVQTLPGYCLLLADPIAFSINDLDEKAAIAYSLDTIRIGDALLKVTGAYRINYMSLSNQDQALHTHIIPRYQSEPDDKRRGGAMAVYDWANGRTFDPEADKAFVAAMREILAP
jgi:diadenosine tetraphosphate (Ap4A) HIT family hydrolase